MGIVWRASSRNEPNCGSPTPVCSICIAKWISSAAQKGTSCKAFDPIDYKINEDLILIPDILIVCKPIEKKILDFAPALVVEILSPSTAIRDRNIKFEIYEREGVNFYLIIDADKNQAEVYSLEQGKYILRHCHSNKFEFVFDGECKALIDFNDIG